VPNDNIHGCGQPPEHGVCVLDQLFRWHKPGKFANIIVRPHVHALRAWKNVFGFTQPVGMQNRVVLQCGIFSEHCTNGLDRSSVCGLSRRYFYCRHRAYANGLH
jgi:hypothetical protein